jgi:spermidine synthase
VRIVRTRRGARLVEGDVILSEVLARPGATHTLFDVLAASVAALAPGPRVAVLGFAAGGMVAPLRAMGFPHALEAVDLDPAGEALFRELSAEWAGPVSVARMDAVQWLKAQRKGFDLIVEDLSVPSPGGTIKPYATIDELPRLMRDRLAPGGIAVTNLLPLPGTGWPALLARAAHPHDRAAVLALDEYENRFVLAGPGLPDTPDASRRIRAALSGIGSDQARKFRLRTLRRG